MGSIKIAHSTWYSKLLFLYYNHSEHHCHKATESCQDLYKNTCKCNTKKAYYIKRTSHLLVTPEVCKMRDVRHREMQIHLFVFDSVHSRNGAPGEVVAHSPQSNA